MYQFDKSGSQLMCMIKGKGCIALALTLLITMVVNMVLVMIMINSEIITTWQKEKVVLHGLGEISHNSGPTEDALDSPRPERVDKVHVMRSQVVKDPQKNTPNYVQVLSVTGSKEGPKELRRIPVMRPTKTESDIQMAVYTSVRPKKTDNDRKKQFAIPYVVSQAAKQTGMELNYPDKRDEYKIHQIGQSPIGAKEDSFIGPEIYSLNQLSTGGSEIGHRRLARNVQQIKEDKSVQSDNVNQMAGAKLFKSKLERKDLSREERRRLRKEHRKNLEQGASKKETAAISLHSLSAVPLRSEDMQRKTNQRYPAFVKKSRKSDNTSQEKDKRKKDRKKTKKGRSKKVEEGESFSARDLKTFKKHMKKIEKRDPSLQVARNSKNIHKEFNIDHRTDEEWEAHDDMSLEHLVVADKKVKQRGSLTKKG